MRLLLALTLLCGSLLLAGDPDINADVSVKASSITRQGPIHQLRGNAVLETSAVVVRADEIDFNQETNEIEARGAVRMKLKGNPSYLFVDGPRPPQERRIRPFMPPEVIK